MTIRPLILKILGPPAVLFLVLVTVYVTYQSVVGIIDTKAMKSETSKAIDSFHARFNRGDLASACTNEYGLRESPLDCMSQLEDVKLRFGSFQKLLKAEFQVFSEPHWVRIETVSIFDKGELTEKFLAVPMSDSDLKIVDYRALMAETNTDR